MEITCYEKVDEEMVKDSENRNIRTEAKLLILKKRERELQNTGA